MHSSPTTRRDFLRNTTALGAGLWLGGSARLVRPLSANDRLNLGIVGVANRGAANLAEVAGENIVALCDVDEMYLGQAAAQFPAAHLYHDFRRMLDRSDLDAVVISTPDHTHAVASILAMQAGLDVYCEKPLTHSVKEARAVAETAQRLGRVTQMGTQIHAGANYRRVVELVQGGAIGAVREAHAWVGKSHSGHGQSRPSETPAVPAHLHWDLWLGPAAERPYHPAYLPGTWRQWWEFGGGTLADMGCHYIDVIQWALHLGAPRRVAARGPEPHPDTTPTGLAVEWEFPEREAAGSRLPALVLHWYDSGKRPPHFAEGLLPEWGDGVLFVGEKGMLLADYGRHVLLPAEDFQGFQPPSPWIPDSVGHHQEWIEACKSRGPTTCNFGYAGRLTESVLLGNVAFRTSQELQWDSATMTARGCPEAALLLERTPREGWAWEATEATRAGAGTK